MPQANQTPLVKNSGVVMMEVMEKIREKIDSTREEVIKLGTRQEEDRKRHDERHLENQDWRKEHNRKHDDIMKQLEEIDQHTSNLSQIEPSKPIDKNRMMTFGFIIFILLIALIYGLTGNEMPSVGDIANIAGGVQ
jgi:hypothetical protein